MHQHIYEELKRVASSQKSTTYSRIAPLADLDMSRSDHRNEIAAILDEISRYEHAQERPMLSAVVVHSDGDGEAGGLPGGGFFTLATDLGLYRGQDKVAFFVSEFGRVLKTWEPAGKKESGIGQKAMPIRPH